MDSSRQSLCRQTWLSPRSLDRETLPTPYRRAAGHRPVRWADPAARPAGSTGNWGPPVPSRNGNRPAAVAPARSQAAIRIAYRQSAVSRNSRAHPPRPGWRSLGHFCSLSVLSDAVPETHFATRTTFCRLQCTSAGTPPNSIAQKDIGLIECASDDPQRPALPCRKVRAGTGTGRPEGRDGMRPVRDHAGRPRYTHG